MAFASTGAHAEWQGYDCTGGYLVGFNAMAGDWVDRIGAICAPWNAKTHQLGTPVEQQPLLASSGGGSFVHSVCPPTTVVAGIRYNLPLKGDNKVAQDVQLSCKRVTEPHDTMTYTPTITTVGKGGDDIGTDFLSGDPKSTGATFTDSLAGACPDGQAAQGFQADVGTYVGMIGIKCRPWLRSTSVLSAAEMAHLNRSASAATGQQQSSSSVTSEQMGRALRRMANSSGSSSSPSGTPPASTPPPVAGDAIIEGEWNTTEGTMTLSQSGNQLTGHYSNGTSQVFAKSKNGGWTGNWVQPKSDRTCPPSPLATLFWGQMQFTFSNQNRHFDGQWSYCTDPLNGSHPWSGDRVK